MSRRALARMRSLRAGARLPAAIALLAGLLAACSAGSAPHSTSPASPSGLAYPSGPPLGPAGPLPTTLAGYYAQKLRWRPCDHGFQCARLLVPFDYQRPGVAPLLAAGDPAARHRPWRPGSGRWWSTRAAQAVLASSTRSAPAARSRPPCGPGSMLSVSTHAGWAARYRRFTACPMRSLTGFSPLLILLAIRHNGLP